VKSLPVADHRKPSNLLRVCEVRTVPRQKIIYIMNSGNRDVGSVPNGTLASFCFFGNIREKYAGNQEKSFRLGWQWTLTQG
jgi:hypothetical protein